MPLLVVLWLLNTAVYPQSTDGLQPPGGRILWVGPEAECGFTNLQDAVANAYNCGSSGCPPGVARIRLSTNYNHSGFTLLDKNLKIQGGYSSCQGSYTGDIKTISAISPNSRLFAVTNPSSANVQVELQDLAMFGTTGNALKGGVIVMGAGNTTLRLIDSVVTSGTAEEGGGIAMLGDGNVLEIHDSSVIDNQAILGDFGAGDGGGIYCENGGLIQFHSGEISDNEAERRGGGLVLDDCQLVGDTESQHRHISNNTVLRSASENAAGQGGGIFATGGDSIIELGALLSRTIISHNTVAEWQPELIQTNVATAGGMLLRLGASANLTNVQFIGNQAPNGGGVTLESNSSLEMDRSTGPCYPTELQQCSAFIDNEATGVGFDGSGFAGSGSAIYSNVEGNGSLIDVKRTVFRGNDGYQHNGEGGIGSMVYISNGDTLLAGNLMFLNALEDDLSIVGNDRYGSYLRFRNGSADLIQNTIAFNENSGSVLRVNSATVHAIGNLIFDPAQEYGIMDNDISDQAIYSACNVTSDEPIDTVANGGDNAVVSDPGFLDSSMANFRLVNSSPAVNRCDNQNGVLNMSYDILGRFRPIVNGSNNGSGVYDAGAYEYHPNSGGDVDLQASLTVETLSGPFGAEFSVYIKNIGMNPARHPNTYVLFEEPASTYTTSGDWNCSEQLIDGLDMVECRHQTTGTGEIPVLGFSSLLTVFISPDDVSECGLAITVESRGLDRDTNSSNNAAEYEVSGCQFSDLIFKNGFK